MAEAVIKVKTKDTGEQPVYDEQYRHSIVSSRYTPHTSLLSHVPGIPVLTEYYRRFKNSDEGSDGYQPGSEPVYQSYTRIKGLIIKFENAENFQFDGETGTSTKNGIGYVLFDLAPMKNDLFIKDVGDGRAGLFQITEQPEYKNVSNDKCYQIEFRMISFVNKVIEDDLNRKVVKELTYSKDSHLNGGAAILTTEELKQNKDLIELSALITEHIMTNFFWNQEKTIVIPNNDRITYDPYLAKFLSMTLPIKRMGMRESIILLNADYAHDDMGKNKLTVWDMFYRNTFNYPSIYKRDYYLHDKRNLLGTRNYGNVYFSDVDDVILYHEYGAPKAAYTLRTGLMYGDLDQQFAGGGVKGEKYDYFFTDDFYEGSGKEIENFVWKYFRDGVIDRSLLIETLKNYFNLTPMEQVYMGGIYVGATKRALSTTFEYV